MSDSDWRDPFADDQAGRERQERRVERDRQRREEGTREGLGERVREELAATSPPAAPVPPTDSRQEPEAEPEPPPPTRPPSNGTIHRRRVGALVGLGALIAAIAGAGAFLSQRGGDEPAPAPDAGKARKTIEVVIPEGFDRSQVAGVTKEAGLEGDYEKATESSKAIDLEKLGAKDAQNLEGFLFPATYELFKGAKVDALVTKQLEAFQANLAEVDLAAAEAKGYDAYDVVIIASMIEREIAVAEERKLAASVIYNRLEAGTPLGIDATIRFEDQNYDEPLVQSRLDMDTPYNTRINPGQPPGPIGNPGLASLQAAAAPAESDFFFFVVKPGSCNEHTFVETEAEFARAEASYQAALQAQGGSPTEC